jgi:hypothetical protein
MTRKHSCTSSRLSADSSTASTTPWPSRAKARAGKWSGSGSAASAALTSRIGTIPISATVQKCGRISRADRRSPAHARHPSISITGPVTASRVSAISPGMTSATSPAAQMTETSRSARMSGPHGSERAVVASRVPPGSVTRRHRNPDRNTEPSRLTLAAATDVVTSNGRLVRSIR